MELEQNLSAGRLQGEVMRLQKRVAELEAAAAAPFRHDVRRVSHELVERMKELRCLYQLGRLMATPGISLPEIFQGAVELIPPAWQFPALTSARLRWDRYAHQTSDFVESAFRQNAAITVQDAPDGFIEVFYRENPDPTGSNPFLHEENELLNEIAERLGGMIHRWISEKALRESEERFRQIVEHADVWVWEIDMAGLYTYSSPIVKKLLGYSPAELVGKMHFHDLFPTASRESLRSLSMEALARGESFQNFENLCLHKDGHEVLMSTNGVPICDENGLLRGYRGSDQDVTAGRRAEKALRASEELLRAILDSSTEGIFGMDLDGNCTFCNAAALALFGYREQRDLLGRNVHATLHYQTQTGLPFSPDTCRLLAAVQCGAKVHLDDEIFWRADGCSFFAECWSHPFHRDGTLAGAVVSFFDVTERKIERERLRTTAERLDLTLESTGIGILHWDIAEDRMLVDSQARLMLGCSESVFPGTVQAFLDRIHPADLPRVRRSMMRTKEQGEPYSEEYRVVWPDKSERHVLARGRLIANDSGEPQRVDGIMWDITERRNLEQQLTQAQKMEAIGHLAGGIAHDFNNLLQVILVNASLVQQHHPADLPACESVEEILTATRRATDLTRQLLTFSRRQTLQPEHADLNTLIEGILKMLRRLLGEQIDLAFLADHDLGTVFVDRGQIEQVIVNLCVNARDAMPTGGRITIETHPQILDDHYCQMHLWAKPGTYAQMTVSDTGHGMDKETLLHIFEPFFSTKAEGKGTGLGLATAYGIVQQHSGLIHVYSEPGAGTVFKIYLPSSNAAPIEREKELRENTQGGTETILIAEDDPNILRILAALLRDAGYTVFEAQNGNEALSLYDIHAGELDLMLLDVIMPGIGGREVMQHVRTRDAHLPCLFCSGYTATTIHDNLLPDKNVHLIQKPFSKDTLLGKIRELLDARA